MDAKFLSTLRGTKVSGELQYHDTVVAKWNEDAIVLDNGGSFTPTTIRRMNQASNVFGLGYRVYRSSYEMYAEYKGKVYQFYANKVTLRRGV
jgi:hypothetical protein